MQHNIEQNPIVPPLTPSQIEQLIKLIPSSSTISKAPSDTDEELELPYVGMVTCYHAEVKSPLWIIDSAASDHMTGTFSLLSSPVSLQQQSSINLPNGHTSHITHIGSVQLHNSLKLSNVLYVLDFKHILLYVQQLSRENGCKVIFENRYCLILDASSVKLKGVGKAQNDFYYLVD